MYHQAQLRLASLTKERDDLDAELKRLKEVASKSGGPELVVTRMYEDKIKDLSAQLAKVSECIDLRNIVMYYRFPSSSRSLKRQLGSSSRGTYTIDS